MRRQSTRRRMWNEADEVLGSLGFDRQSTGRSVPTAARSVRDPTGAQICKLGFKITQITISLKHSYIFFDH